MMNLYYSPGACSQAVHILLHETGFRHDSTRVDLATKRTEHGDDYLAINPKGAVPALQLDSGDVLTENAVILQYLGDMSGSTDLLPPMGDFRRYRVLEWLNFVATELHKSFSPFFRGAGEETQAMFRDLIANKFHLVDDRLGRSDYLCGEELTIADPYLFVMTGWAAMQGFDVARWSNVSAFRDRMMERPAVRNVLRFEGLLQDETAG